MSSSRQGEHALDFVPARDLAQRVLGEADDSPGRQCARQRVRARHDHRRREHHAIEAPAA
jgi:hypothetical protein